MHSNTAKFWSLEMQVRCFLGRMPVTKSLPMSWYETDNSHLCTIKDFETSLFRQGFVLKNKKYLNKNYKESWLSSLKPNLFASEGVYLIAKD